jgi:hypothetical protein
MVTDFETNFINGPEIHKVIENVARILGLDNLLDFSKFKIYKYYTISYP